MKEKVNVTGVPETMVQTLYARAKETRKKNNINDIVSIEEPEEKTMRGEHHCGKSVQDNR